MTTPSILLKAQALASRGLGMCNKELAVDAGISTSAAGAYISRYVEQGHLFAAGETRRRRYFTSKEAADAFNATYTGQSDSALDWATHDLIARAAVSRLRKGMLSSVQLAEACNCSAEIIDTALAGLVDEKKLTRVDVVRGGRPMFDYRISAGWQPSNDDYAVPHLQAVPKASISPVAPPKAAPAPMPPPPPPRTPAPRVIAPAVTAAALGWSVAESDNRPKVTGTGLDAVLGQADARTILEANDVVYAMNSRGELAIDLGDDAHIVRLPAAQALALKQFLDNTSVLEELSGRGAI